jgi:hypothetical protein
MRVSERYAAVERSALPVDDGSGESEVIEVERPFTANNETLRVRTDSVPQATVAMSPDDAAAMAIAMQRLSDERLGADGKHQLGFSVEYFV